MTDPGQLPYLRWALRIVGAFAVFALYPLTVLWPSGWAWDRGESPYLPMIIALYAVLGVLLFIAARDPERHVLLVSFAIWSSVVHGGVMAVQAVWIPGHAGHLLGDVPALFVAAAVLGFLSPEALRLPFTGWRSAGSTGSSGPADGGVSPGGPR